MLTDVMQSNSVLKLKGILTSRYGLGLKLMTLMATEENEANQSHDDKRGVLRGGSLYLRINARGKYLATAVVSGVESLEDGDLTAVSELVRLVLEPALFSRYLDTMESNVQNSVNENVIPLRSHQVINTEWFENRPEFATSLLFLESFNSEMISRVATHIHELGSRWALLRFTDVQNQIQSIQDLKELGPMTLLVEDVQMLSREEQKIIFEFSKESESKQEPLILIGSKVKLSELFQNGFLLKDLYFKLMLSCLELDRMPKDFNGMKEAIELFLDRKALLN